MGTRPAPENHRSRGTPTDWRCYRIEPTGINARLLAAEPPGWSAKELLDELLARPVRIAAFDFPFGIPDALLCDEKFAVDAGHARGAFGGWRAFNAFVAEQLPLADPLNYRRFVAWRSRVDRSRLWTKRATDIAAGGQPPLKDKFQATFQMTLLGNALLARLWKSNRSDRVDRGVARVGSHERRPDPPEHVPVAPAPHRARAHIVGLHHVEREPAAEALAEHDRPGLDAHRPGARAVARDACWNGRREPVGDRARKES